ncbi:MAG TPA: ABC transporter substrate-binding protein [Syntrophales bacterium]|nr:ABC transporter substrate-binding protein [Syntrophales bacterium]
MKGWNVMKRVVLLSLILLVASAVAAGAEEAKPVKIGAAINLTGPASTFGQYHAKGFQDYLTYVNEVKGGVAGRQIDWILVDTAYKVPEALAAVRKFATQENVDMMATWSTGEGLAAKPILQRYGIPTINFSTGWEILEPPVDYIYLPFGSYKLDCYAIFDYIKAVHQGKEPARVGLLTYNNAYGRSIHKPSREYAEKIGIDIVAVEEFPAKTVDLTTELLRLKKSGADYVVLQMLPAAIITTLKSADRIEYRPQFLGTWTSTDPDFFRMGQGLLGDRLVIQFPGGLPSDGTPGIKVFEELVKRYKTIESFDASYWEGVAVAMIMERAVQRAAERSGKVTRETINGALESFQGESMGGLVPDVSYSKDNHEGSFKARIVRVHEDGRFVPLSNFFTPGKEPIVLLQEAGK